MFLNIYIYIYIYIWKINFKLSFVWSFVNCYYFWWAHNDSQTWWQKYMQKIQVHHVFIPYNTIFIRLRTQKSLLCSFILIPKDFVQMKQCCALAFLRVYFYPECTFAVVSKWTRYKICFIPHSSGISAHDLEGSNIWAVGIFSSFWKP